MRNLWLVLLILAATLAPTSAVAIDDSGTAAATIVVPRDARTIQEAIDRVADGGTVRIAPGTYLESLDIAKRVDLIGDGPRSRRRAILIAPTPRTVVPLETARGVLNYHEGGGGNLENLTVVGGDAAVLGLSSGRGPVADVRVRNVSMLRNARGVAGRFGSLRLEYSAITQSLGHGVSLVCVQQLEVFGMTITNAGQVGLLVGPCAETQAQSVSLSGVSIGGNHAGGAAIFGSVNVAITDSTFSGNHVFGVLLSGTPGSTPVINSSFTGTAEGAIPSGTIPGDGLIAVGTGNLAIIGSDFVGNQRAGVLLYDVPTQGSFAQSVVSGNQLGIVLANFSTGDCATLVVNGSLNILTGNTEDDVLDTCADLGIPPPPPVPEH